MTVSHSPKEDRTVAYLLSRQSRRPSPDDWWIRATMAATEWAAHQGYHLWGSAGLLPLDFVRWAHARAGGEVTLVDITSHPSLQRTRTAHHDLGIDEHTFVLDTHADAPKEELYARRDAFIIHSADLIIAIAVRRGGVMEKLGRQALAMGLSVHALEPPNNTKSFAGNRALLAAGATRLELDIPEVSPQSQESIFRLRPADDIQARDYLWHYTRSCAGPWPGQSWSEYFGSLGDNAPGATHAGNDTLAHIVEEQRIRASAFLIREGFRVVCFSEKSPEELTDIRTYRPGLIRWNFEPYGVGIHKDAADKIGLRPVHYAARSEYDALSPSDRWLFQVHEPPRTDWTNEAEWRHLGDVQLGNVPAGALAVYVDGGYFSWPPD